MILPDCPKCAERLAPLRADTGGFWWVSCITRQDPVKAAEELRRIREEQDY